MSKKQILEWCTSQETVSSLLAQDPSKTPAEIADTLYQKSKLNSALAKVGIRKHPSLDDPTPADLDWAASCGKFTQRPSDLYLKVLANVLVALEKDPLAGLCSPPLLAATGTIPLSIISVIPDQMRHYANCIIRTEQEALIATNYLEQSNTAKLIANSLRELSKRHEGRGSKVVVKFMYDRGSAKQVVENHQLVPPELWPDVDLPKPDEIPNIDLQIVNFHRPALGTFHTKMAVFDRKIALLSSCNMQDRVNVEMTVHLEGAIVDSFYDVFLLSWSRKLEPAPPLLNKPAVSAGHEGKFGADHQHLKDIDVQSSATRARQAIGEQHEEMQQGGTGETAAERHAMEAHHAPDQVLSDRTATGDTRPTADRDNAAELAGHLDEMNLKERGPDALARHLNVDGPVKTTPTTKDPVDDFNPILLHNQHEPFPICMVNRRPHGRPGHGDISNPQDAAWLAGFKFAQRKIFIQTPTFNSTDVVAAALEACRRGVTVTLWLDLGFNDQGEMIPGQGGTNEDNVQDMFAVLKKDGKEEQLRVFWYTAKDQRAPLNAKEKSRNCHVKFFSADDQIAVVGNGNQDTQSWYHSQEINVLVDSPAVIAEWHAALERNQNTGLHGKVDNDGIWRYPDGTRLEGLATKRGGPVQGITQGVGGAIARARGTGGF